MVGCRTSHMHALLGTQVIEPVLHRVYTLQKALRCRKVIKEFRFEYFQFKERKVKHNEKVHSTVKGRLVSEEC